MVRLRRIYPIACPFLLGYMIDHDKHSTYGYLGQGCAGIVGSELRRVFASVLGR